jgi:nitrate reductase assembly molybdenum cofactor insertion protein NarJ
MNYNKAVLMSNSSCLTMVLTLKEDVSHASPISSVFYETYDNLAELQNRLETEKNKYNALLAMI